jgi:1-acyl-sn-glycerol-3-phosphate acyltransferase
MTQRSTALDAMAASVPHGDPGRPAAWVVWLFGRVARPFVALFWRPTISGLEHIPKEGPFLLVANHNGVFGIAEIFSFAILYLARFGTSRPLAGFAHPFGFKLWPLSILMRGLGAIPSTYAAGEAALANGVGLLVFPGGDHEAARPIWRANQVDFGGRKGFLKMARRAGVPIIPMGIRGSHYSAPVLWRSDLVLAYLVVAPRLFGVKRYPITLLALAGAVAILLLLPALGPWRFLLAYAWFASPLALLPWVPWTVSIRVGEPIAAGELFAEGDDLGPALARVESAVGALVRR